MMYRVSILIVSVLLSGCQEEEVHTVEYFVNNEAQRTERMATCELQDRADEDANCANARSAMTLAASKAAQEAWEAEIESTQPAPTN